MGEGHVVPGRAGPDRQPPAAIARFAGTRPAQDAAARDRAGDATGALQVRRLVLSPLPAARLARAASGCGTARLFLPLRWPVLAADWYVRLAWCGGACGVVTKGRAVLA